MKWFKKKKHDPDEIITNDVPVSTLVRWFLYDTSLVDPNDAAHLVGLTRVSDEGDAKEVQDSEDRLAEIDELIPFLSAMSEISSTALANIQAAQIMEDDPDAGEKIMEDIGAMQSMYQVVALATLINTFSTAIKLGIIRHDLKSLSMLDMEELYDEQ